MEPLPTVIPWPPLTALARLSLALAVGLFIGLEREWRGKEAGLRTFGFAALLGGMGGLVGPAFALLSVALLIVLVIFLNLQSLRAEQGAELTTSAALMVTGMTGVLCGLGHTVTPAAVAVVTAGLLAWKERLAGFSHKITAEELRSAILLAILAFGIYPVLPVEPVDPWGLIAPRAAWVTVMLIAAIGFLNYLLWKFFGDRGVLLTGVLGGMVNSTVTVTELGASVKQAGARLADVAYRGVMLATSAMAVRNALLLGLLALTTFYASALPLGLIAISSAVLAFLPGQKKAVEGAAAEEAPALPLKSPFSLPSALKFGLMFLGLQVAGTLGQSLLGRVGFYAVSLVGGVVSSASAVASAASLAAHGKISPGVAAVGAVLASLASATVNYALAARVAGDRALSVRLGKGIAVVIALGVLGALLQSRWT